jgi:hypothetical protein
MNVTKFQKFLGLAGMLTISTAAVSVALAAPLVVSRQAPYQADRQAPYQAGSQAPQQAARLAPLRAGPAAPLQFGTLAPMRMAPAAPVRMAPLSPRLTPETPPGPLPIKPRGFSKRVPDDVKNGVLQDLNTTLAIQGNGATPVFVKIFGGPLNGQSLLKFFADRIANFDMDSCGGGSSVAACVQPNLDPHTMWLTPNYVRWNMPEISRISIIFHESRHTEAQNNFWGHVNCPVPYKDENGNDILGLISGNKMEGQPACDTTPYGAYGLEAVLLKNIQVFCTNCTAKVKMDAMLFANDTYNRISDKKAAEILKKDDPTWK